MICIFDSRRRLLQHSEGIFRATWMVSLLIASVPFEAARGQPEIEHAEFSANWKRSATIVETGDMDEDSSPGTIVSDEWKFHHIDTFSMPYEFPDGQLLLEMVKMDTLSGTEYRRDLLLSRPAEILDLRGILAIATAQTEVGRIASLNHPELTVISTEHFSEASIDLFVRWKEMREPPEPVDKIPVTIISDLLARVELTALNYIAEARATLQLKHLLSAEVVVDEVIGANVNSVTDATTPQRVEQRLPNLHTAVMWEPDDYYMATLSAFAQAIHVGSSDHPRGYAQAGATADPIIEIDPEFPYKDYYELEISPNLVPPRVEHVGFANALINGASQIAYRTEALIGEGEDEEAVSAFLVGTSAQQQPLVYTGLEAPGTSEDFKSLTSAALNSQGMGALWGTFLEAPEPNRRGIWVGVPDDLQLLVREGLPAPDVSDAALLTDFSSPSLSDNGQAAFAGALGGEGVDGTNNQGFWVGTPGNVQVLVRKGDAVPDLPVGTVFSAFSGDTPMINGNGQVAFRSDIRGTVPDVLSINDSGIWMGTPGALEMVVRENDPAPGLSAGLPLSQRAFFDLFDDKIYINDAGHLAFWAELRGTEVVPNVDDYAIFAGPADALELVMRRNDPVPGSTDVLFSFPRPNSLVLGGGGHVAFENLVRGAGVSPDNDDALWFGTPGEIALLAREGDHAPGTEDGVTFARFDGRPVTNDWGVAFQATLGGPGITAANGDGIWGLDPAGQLRLVARTGQNLNVGSGEFKTISELFFMDQSGGEDGLGSSFNDLGQLIFNATFTDGSFDVFVSDLLTYALTADFDGDGDVDRDDSAQWQGDFGINGNSDADGDGDSDGADLLIWQRQTGNGVTRIPSTSSVPEPNSATLLLTIFAIGLLAGRWKRR